MKVLKRTENQNESTKTVKKYAKNKAEHEESLVTDNPGEKEPNYTNTFKCGENILNKIDATCERFCMETSRGKYYTKIYKTPIDYNYRNDAPLSNEKN